MEGEEDRRQHTATRSIPRSKKARTDATQPDEPTHLDSEETKDEEPSEPRSEEALKSLETCLQARKRRELQAQLHQEQVPDLSMEAAGAGVLHLAQDRQQLGQVAPGQPAPPLSEEATSSEPRSQQGRSHRPTVPRHPAEWERSGQDGWPSPNRETGTPPAGRSSRREKSPQPSRGHSILEDIVGSDYEEPL